MKHALTFMAAQKIFDYLAVASPDIGPADAVWGFGHFDLNIPERCANLYAQGRATRILFSGGIGSGTADLGQPEARAFADNLRRRHPEIPADAVFIEDASTNTGENVQFTRQRLARQMPEAAFGHGIRSVILVANAYRQRRVWLTCRKQLPGLRFVNAPPPTTFERECDMFAAKGFDVPTLLLGEIDRLQRYADAGYIVAEPLPQEIQECYQHLQSERET